MEQAYQELFVEDNVVRVVRRYGPTELHTFSTAQEAEAKAAVVRESLTWIGTPFVDCADIKGRRPVGGVDCAMKLVRCYVDTGLVPPFDPRPYDPKHMLHSDEQIFLNWIEEKIAARRVDGPRLGDVTVYQWGRVFAHGAININNDEICHAYAFNGMVLPSPKSEPLMRKISLGVKYGTWDRPTRHYDVWRG